MAPNFLPKSSERPLMCYSVCPGGLPSHSRITADNLNATGTLREKNGVVVLVYCEAAEFIPDWMKYQDSGEVMPRKKNRNRMAPLWSVMASAAFPVFHHV